MLDRLSGLYLTHFWVLLLLPACGHMESAGTRVVYRDRLVEVQRPCPVEAPARPAPLARPLPSGASALVDLLTAKLAEYAGRGGYADRADAAIKTCTKE